jgi:hypothetical protein
MSSKSADDSCERGEASIKPTAPSCSSRSHKVQQADLSEATPGCSRSINRWDVVSANFPPYLQQWGRKGLERYIHMTAMRCNLLPRH